VEAFGLLLRAWLVWMESVEVGAKLGIRKKMRKWVLQNTDVAPCLVEKFLFSVFQSKKINNQTLLFLRCLLKSTELSFPFATRPRHIGFVVRLYSRIENRFSGDDNVSYNPSAAFYPNSKITLC
jgi:hypothetical protein